MLRAATHWRALQPSTTMQYGPCSGTSVFRTRLANFLTDAYVDGQQNPVSSEHLFQTSGATHGLSLALTTWFGRTPLERRTAFLEDPSYFLAPSMLREHGFQLNPVPLASRSSSTAVGRHATEHDGIDLDFLEKSVLDAKAAGRLAKPDEAQYAAVVYVIPTYHNPTGATMPPAARQRLVDLARAHNLLVVSDDVYELLHYPASAAPAAPADIRPRPPPRLVSYDLGDGAAGCGGHVLSNGTFSKIMSPGVRCGWIEAHPALIRMLSNAAIVSSSGGSAQLMGSMLASAIETGEAAHMLHTTRALLARRMAAVRDAFAACAPRGCALTVPDGGMCAWLSLPEELDAHAVLVASRRRGVSFKPGDLFSSSGRFRNHCRIVVAHYDEATLVAVACGPSARSSRTLCEVIEDGRPRTQLRRSSEERCENVHVQRHQSATAVCVC